MSTLPWAAPRLRVRDFGLAGVVGACLGVAGGLRVLVLAVLAGHGAVRMAAQDGLGRVAVGAAGGGGLALEAVQVGGVLGHADLNLEAQLGALLPAHHLHPPREGAPQQPPLRARPNRLLPISLRRSRSRWCRCHCRCSCPQRLGAPQNLLATTRARLRSRLTTSAPLAICWLSSVKK